MAGKKRIAIGDRVRRANFVKARGSSFTQAKSAKKGVVIGFGVSETERYTISIRYEGDEKINEELLTDWQQNARYVRGIWNMETQS